MKKVLLLIASLTLLLMGTSPTSEKLVRLTIVNKSGLPLGVKLTGNNIDNFYYLRIPAGDRVIPTEKVFTIAQDTYTIQPYYIEIWDPVYGSSCGSAASKTLYAFRNIRITFLECRFVPRHLGDPPIYKWPGFRYIY